MREDDPIDVPPGTPPEKIEKIVLPTYRPGEHRYYRLPDGLDTPSHSTQLIKFRFRTRYISTIGTIISSIHPDVFRIAIDRPPLLRFLESCFQHIPSFVRSWIYTLFPEWLLPDYVVLKPERKEEETLFNTELRAYEYLKPAQGTLVPEVCGKAVYNKRSALLLKDVGGIPLASPEGAMLTMERLSELLQECFLALHRLGVHQLDPNPGNYHLVDGKLVALDFGDVDFDLSEDDKQVFMISRISTILKYYRELQLVYEHDGKLIPVDNVSECV